MFTNDMIGLSALDPFLPFKYSLAFVFFSNNKSVLDIKTYKLNVYSSYSLDCMV